MGGRAGGMFGTYLKQGYDLVTPLSLVDPFTMIARIAAHNRPQD
jgi:hypothetical protein